MINRLFFICSISLLLSSCGGIKVAGGGSNVSKLYEVFYIQNGVTQYFVKPLKFKNDGIKFTADFTLRNDVTPEKNIVCNFSLYSPEPIKNVEKVTITTGQSTMELFDLEKVFIEKQKNGYHLRYTSKMKFSDFSMLTKTNSSTFKVDNVIFESPKKVVKKLNKVDEYVIDIIELSFE